MIYLEEHHAQIIKDILSKHPYKFYVFGSRAKGTHRKLSDLDLCYYDNIPFRELRKLEEAFQDSDLPFKVDIVNFNACSDSFKELIEKETIPFDDKNLG